MSSASAHDPLFHIALPEHWTAALATGEYAMSWRRPTFGDVGFVHLSFRHQLARTAKRLYRDVASVMLLEIDAARCDGAVVLGPATDTADEHFPHLYRPLGLDLVARATTWTRGPGGRYQLDR